MTRFVRSALAAALFAAPAVALAQATPVIAVLYFDNNSFGPNRSDYDGLGKGIADMLITDMASNTNVRVVERERIQSLLTEQSLTRGGSIDPQTAVRLGKLIGAQYMITGGFMSDGRGSLILTARAINVETSAITNPTKLQSKGDDVLGLINQLSTRLNADMQLPALRVGENSGAHAATPAGAPAAPAPSSAPAMAASASAMGSASAAQPATQTASVPAATTPAATTPAPAMPAAPRPQSPAAQTRMDLRTALLYSRALEEEDAGNRSRAVELYRQVVDKFPNYAPARAKIERLSRG